MRVLVLSSVFPNPRRPAFGVFIKERARRVARHCDLTVVAPVPWFPLNGLIRGPEVIGIPRIEEREGLRVHHPRFFCIPRYLKWLDGVLYAASLLPFLARLRRSFPFDLIDAHFAYPDGLAGVLLGRAFNVPVMITLRGSIVRLSGYPLHRPQIRWALERAAGIVAVSRSLKAVAMELGISGSRIQVISNGVDTDRFHPADRVAARATCGLPQDRAIVLSVGGVYEGKGQHVVLEALVDLLRRHPRLLYVIVGSGQPGDPYRKTIQAFISAHRLGGHVLFAGPRPHDELPHWYAAADVFCLATRSEGWANVLLESIATGVPVVATRVGGNPEIVREGRDGLLVAPGDSRAIAAAIDEALGRRWDTDAMIAYARTQSWERAKEGVLEEFARLVSVPGGTRVGLAAGPWPGGRS